MAASEVSVSNLALTKLETSAITSLSENSTNGRACAAAYEPMRDRELRAHPWSFAKTLATLAPHATAPDHSYAYAFPLPADFLRLLPPARHGLDWTIKRHENVSCILTNDGSTLEIEYVAKVTDPTAFDPLFIDALATRMALHMVGRITGSATKKESLKDDYRAIIAEARKVNAIEQISQDPPIDTWLEARETGWSGMT